MTAVPAQYQGDVQDAATYTGLPEPVVAAQISAESGFNPNALSPAGAEGIAQFLPGTFAAYAAGAPDQPATPYDVPDAFYAYARFMRSLLGQFGGNVQDSLAAYNAGPGNIQAGMGYADTILAAAGLGTTTTAGPGTGAVTTSATGSGFRWYEPWTWLGAAQSSAQQGVDQIVSGTLRYIAEGTAVVAGLGLVVWGIGRATGAGHRATTIIETAAPAAAAAA